MEMMGKNENQKWNVKAVLFDLDDTLYNLADPFIAAYDRLYAGKYMVDREALFFYSRSRSDEVYERSMRGEISMEDMYVYRYRNAFADAGIEISREEALTFQRVYETCQRKIYLSETIKEMLAYCKGHVQTGIVTNGPSGHQWDKIHDLGLLSWIPKEHVFISAEAGCAKPGKEIFDLAADRLNIAAEGACFAGDSFACDITGAAGAGWRTIWMNHRRRKPLENGVIPDYEVHSEEEFFRVIQKITQ